MQASEAVQVVEHGELEQSPAGSVTRIGEDCEQVFVPHCSPIEVDEEDTEGMEVSFTQVINYKRISDKKEV